MEAKEKQIHVVANLKLEVGSFTSYFEKINAFTNKINSLVNAISIKSKLILKPVFKQVITANLKFEGKEFYHISGGYTLLKIFPYPKYSNTIYLLKLDNVGLIQSGYAVYR